MGVDAEQVCFATAGWHVDDYESIWSWPRNSPAAAAPMPSGGQRLQCPGLVPGSAASGCRVPEDVALVGWGYETVGRGVIPALSTVDFNFEEWVGSALDLLAGD